MSGRQPSTVTAFLLAAVALAPARARADRLPEPELALPERAAAVELALAGEDDLTLAVPEQRQPDLHAAPPERLVPAASTKRVAAASSLDFDLLGDAPKPKIVAEDPSMKTRRSMLNLHQGLGLGLFGLQLASTVTGQLNYSDKFGTSNTGRYKATHQVLVYSNLAAFAVVGGIALFAPTEKNAPPRPFGRTTIHKIGMALATVGMLSQGALGIRTAQREGYLDKQSYGRAHLAVGYATLAAMSVAVGAIVF